MSHLYMLACFLCALLLLFVCLNDRSKCSNRCRPVTCRAAQAFPTVSTLLCCYPSPIILSPSSPPHSYLLWIMSSENDPLPPIAIIGMGMRLPGGVSTGEDFWNLIVNKQDARCRVPLDRYNTDGFSSAKSRKETVATEYGYFLKDVNYKTFDTSFFDVNHHEVQMMDPQQRLLLEVVWECIENAGVTNLQGSKTAVYVGSYGEDWNQLVHQDTQSCSVYRVLNTSDFIMSNAISYHFDLRGPSMTIRTACSAAMTGLHLACQDLYNGECSTAIVAGSSVIMGPSMTQDMTSQGVLSTDGICKTFDAAANGYARAEGVNAILIKPLKDAIRDGDPIRAVIRSTAVNSDGKTSNIGVPSPECQEVMIRQAYRKAGIDDPGKTAFIECHGTGTAVGDPLETTAIANIFGEHGVYIGSVKPNIGHTEGASGLTGVIKAVLALENDTIPPNIHFSTPNPKIPFEKAKLQVPVEPTPWPQDRHARVGINCFGIGGANAHVILDSAASFGVGPGKNHGNKVVNGTTHSPKLNGIDSPENRPLLLPTSATNSKSLTKQKEGIQQYVADNRSSLQAIAHTLGTRRVHQPHRSFCVTDSTQETLTFSTSQKASSSAPEVAFVFTGQGAQWAGMGQELYHSVPSFRRDIQDMDQVLQSLAEPASWKIEDLLFLATDEDAINKAEYAQSLGIALQLALVNLLTLYGVKPSAVVGHSSGEIASAYVAGALTMREAIICSYMRGLSTKRLTRKGGMAAVGLGRASVLPFLLPGVELACENSPKSTTLSGDADVLEDVMAAIKEKSGDTFVRKLQVDTAYHSSHMEEVGSDFENMLAPYLSAKQTSLPVYSTVTGSLVPPEMRLDPLHWRQSLESPVLFDSAVRAMLGNLPSNAVLVEIGPHAALKGPLRQIIQANCSSTTPPAYISTLVRKEDSMRSLLTAVGQLYSSGCDVNFGQVNPEGPILTDLPLYSWDHSTEYWNESRISNAWRSREHPHHELLGSSYPATGGSSHVWRNLLRSLEIPWLRDHVIVNDVIFPCAGYIAMMGEAIRQVTGSVAYTLRNLAVKSALLLRDTDTLEIITTMRLTTLTDYTKSSWYEFSVSSFNGAVWVEHCIAQGKAAGSDVPESQVAQSSAFARTVPEKYLYQRMERVGLNFGSRFRLLRTISADTESSTARAEIKSGGDACEAEYAAHPTSIDALLQLSVVANSRGVSRHMGSLQVPSRIDHIYVNQADGELVAEAAARPDDTTGLVDITAVKPKGGNKVAIKLEKVKFLRLDTGDDDDSAKRHQQSVGRCTWRPDIEFCDVKGLLRPGEQSREIKVELEYVTTLCILQLLDVVDSGVLTPDDHLTKYVSWLQNERENMSQGKYKLVPQAIEWVNMDAKSRRLLLESHKATVDTLENSSASTLASLICYVAQPDNIMAMCSKEIHPLQILTEEGRLTEWYNNINQLLDASDFFALSAHAQPNMKILEIGAGTGGTTGHILNALQSENGTRMFAKYSFTDISSGFFADAQGRFKAWEGIEYTVLDITKDPISQGFTAGGYDIVLASNVLHATPSLKQTLQNVKLLLRPGGRLYLQELITPTFTRMIPFIAGLLSGWWLGEDDGRLDQPIVSVERWDSELRAAGFCGVEVAVADDDLLHQEMAHITSVVPMPEITGKEVTFLYNKEKHAFALDLAVALEQDGTKIHWHQIGSPGLIDGEDNISTVELEQPYFSDISEDDFADFMACLSGLKGGLLWLTRAAQVDCTDPAYGLILGLARTIRVELSLDFWTTELQHLDSNAIQAATSISRRFLARSPDAGRTTECEFAVHNDTILIGRYDWSTMPVELEMPLQKDDPKQMVITQPGMLDSLRWIQNAALMLQEDEVEVKISCTGLNFRDIMVAMGILQGVNGISTGYEAAGIVSRVGSSVNHLAVGDRVMLMHQGLFATHCIVHGQMVFRIPSELSLEGAATMPIVFCTVVHAIINKGEFEPGQSILIHSACGGVGQAALQICKMLGADVYATVGSDEKAQYLVENYGLPRERIFHSRNASFYDDVMLATNGRGVDIVLNSLSGDLLHASWRCVAEWGRMMEIGKRDMVERGHLPLDMFDNNRTFYGINLDSMFRRPMMLKRLMEQVLQYYAEGHIKPIDPIREFPAHKISEAFRYMQQGQHMGKIIITMPDNITKIPSTQITHELSLSSTATYLLAGGLGGLGKVVTSWMVEKGARSFVFMSRSAGASDTDKAFLAELVSQGCSAVAIAGSVVVMEDVERAVGAAPTPIAGVVQLSMALRDLPLLEMTHDDWHTVYGPKVSGTWNLHKALSGVDLDFFILSSSLSAVFGQYGQASYASANSFLNSFVQFRHSQGLPCSVIDIGAMSGVGAVHRGQQEKQFSNLGMVLLHEQALIDAVQLSIIRSKPPSPVAASRSHPAYTSIGEFAIGMESSRPMDDPGNRHPIRIDIRMGLAWQLARSSGTTTATKNNGIRLLLAQIESDPETLNEQSILEKVTLEIGRALCGFMLVPETNLDINMTLDSMGVDSLVGIEIRNWWKGTLGVDISVLEITNAGTIARLGQLAVSSLKKKHEIHSDKDQGDNQPQNDLSAQFATQVRRLSEYTDSLPDCPKILPEQATVLLTGATGFLGIEILRQLLRHEGVGTVVVLVRAESVERGMDRIKETAKTAGWWTSKDEARVEIWLGDLSKPNVGLEAENLLRVRGAAADQANIDAIVHNGAVVRLSADYEALRVTNVQATVDLLALALSSPASPRFVFVSGGLKMDIEEPFEAVAQELSTQLGYSQTKNMSERITLAMAAQMPAGQNRISVVKPGLIVGTVDNGFTNTNDLIWHAIAVVGALRSCPDMSDEDRWLYVCSVDDITTRIIDQLFATESKSDFVDITDGMMLSTFWNETADELGLTSETQSWDAWIETASKQMADPNTIATLDEVHTFNVKDMPIQQPLKAHDLLRTRKALRSSIRYLQGTGFIESPQPKPVEIVESRVNGVKEVI